MPKREPQWRILIIGAKKAAEALGHLSAPDQEAAEDKAAEQFGIIGEGGSAWSPRPSRRLSKSGRSHHDDDYCGRYTLIAIPSAFRPRLVYAAPHKDRLSQLSTKKSDVCHEAGQQPLEEAHDRKNFAFRRAASSGHPQRLAAQVAVVG